MTDVAIAEPATVTATAIIAASCRRWTTVVGAEPESVDLQFVNTK